MHSWGKFWTKISKKTKNPPKPDCYLNSLKQKQSVRSKAGTHVPCTQYQKGRKLMKPPLYPPRVEFSTLCWDEEEWKWVCEAQIPQPLTVTNVSPPV